MPPRHFHSIPTPISLLYRLRVVVSMLGFGRSLDG